MHSVIVMYRPSLVVKNSSVLFLVNTNPRAAKILFSGEPAELGELKVKRVQSAVYLHVNSDIFMQ